MTLIIKPERYINHRGIFAETYSRRKYTELGIEVEFVQDNHSFSENVGMLRGLHFQAPPHSQAKLVRCGRGAISNVAVDIRRCSTTYDKWQGYELTADNGHQLYVPIGFPHVFLTLEPDSEIVYKCSNYYAPETEGAVLWNGLVIGIDRPTEADLILSDKYTAAPLISNLESPYIFGENS